MKTFLRSLAVVLLVTALITGSVYAYRALTSTGEVTVKEALSFVGPSTFTVDLYPQQSVTASVVVANASPVAMDVDLVSSVTPDPGAKGLVITIPAKVSVPATGQVTVNIGIAAGKSAEPAVYSVAIYFDR